MDIGGCPRRVEGGYIAIHARQLFLGWWLYASGQLTARQLRVYLALFEMRQRRTIPGVRTKSRYRLEELRGLVGGALRSLRTDVSRLRQMRLVRWEKGLLRFARDETVLEGVDVSAFEDAFSRIENRRRQVPVPRRVLRYLAGAGKRVLIATVLGHLLRLCYRKKDQVAGRGRCKASWVADVFGVDRSGVKRHRRLLLDLGLLEAVGDGSSQERFYERRYGKNLRWNLTWSVPSSESEESTERSGLRPQEAESARGLRPVEENRNPLREEETKTFSSGVCTKEESSPKPPPALDGRGGAFPRWEALCLEDLKDGRRLLQLFDQVKDRGVLGGTESERLSFVALAVHAQRYGATNPPGLFRSLVEKRRFYVTQDDEDVAARMLKDALFGGSGGGRKRDPKGGGACPPRSFSDDARMVGQLLRSCRSQGLEDPELVFTELQRVRPEWTRPRWDQAVRELRCAG